VPVGGRPDGFAQLATSCGGLDVAKSGKTGSPTPVMSGIAQLASSGSCFLLSDQSSTSLDCMSTMVGAYEAKTHFAELLERASAGETITVSRHGMPVAQLGPLAQDATTEARAAVDCIRRLRRGRRLGGLSITSLRDEGRR